MHHEFGSAIDPETGERTTLPPEYIEYYFCQHIWPGCTPLDFRQQPIETVLLHLDFWNMEQEHRNKKSS